MVLSVYNPRGDLMATTDPDLASRALWDVFGAQKAEGSGGKDWSIGEHAGSRVVAVKAPFGVAG